MTTPYSSYLGDDLTSLSLEEVAAEWHGGKTIMLSLFDPIQLWLKDNRYSEDEIRKALGDNTWFHFVHAVCAWNIPAFWTEGETWWWEDCDAGRSLPGSTINCFDLFRTWPRNKSLLDGKRVRGKVGPP